METPMPSMRSKTFDVPAKPKEPAPIVEPVAPAEAVTVDPIDEARAFAGEARRVASAISPSRHRITTVLRDFAYQVEEELRRDHTVRP
jgi:hypothetical protein